MTLEWPWGLNVASTRDWRLGFPQASESVWYQTADDRRVCFPLNLLFVDLAVAHFAAHGRAT